MTIKKVNKKKIWTFQNLTNNNNKVPKKEKVLWILLYPEENLL